MQEQKDAIVRYAARNRLEIAAWFEERETAAKRGRPVFTQMLKDLRRGKAVGVIIHKIDRSARNLKDWADLGEFIDQGIEVHFANESLDLHSRGGRLSADIQAVVAADFIRNLREETRKGFYGRIKQGLYPLPAPLGYLNTGKGKVKELDPVKAPLVKKAFQLYGSGQYNLDGLVETLYLLGLRNRNGSKVTRNGVSIILNNPFYIGLIRLRRTSEVFPGSHPPLIGKSVFDRVQDILKGKTNRRIHKHDFLFRRMVTCANCKRSLIGESKKGHVYYRCQNKNCPITCIREEAIEQEILSHFSRLRFSDEEQAYIDQKLRQLKSDWVQDEKEALNKLRFRLTYIQTHMDRLTDAYLEQLIDKDLFGRRKASLLMEQKGIEEKLAALNEKTRSVPDKLAELLELAKSAYLQYEFGLPEQKRDLVKILFSNRLTHGKKLDFTLSFPFIELENRFKNTNGVPYWNRPRTFEEILRRILEGVTSNLFDDIDRYKQTKTGLNEKKG